MPVDVIKIVRRGMGISLQDFGRAGLAQYGVPPSGVMDRHAVTWINRLLDNPPDAPVLEILMQGVHLEVLNTCWLVIGGADARCNFPRWRIIRAHAGESIVFPVNQSGLWSYIAVEGGFVAPRLLGSASTYARGGIGRELVAGQALAADAADRIHLPKQVVGRLIAHDEQRDYNHPPTLRVWRGPQWSQFSAQDQASFFQQAWTVSPRSDRVGYRLEGSRLAAEQEQIISEPVLVGSIQVPPGGEPIVTMRDGPTVGGYPKLGLVDPDDLSWLTQCRPGVPFRFRHIDCDPEQQFKPTDTALFAT